MGDRPRLFVELCAGLASVSLRLQGGARCRPPVSRMGNKAYGYAQAILAAMGLRSGQGAEGYLWCEPDDCRALLQAYGQPEVLAEAAEVIRGWKDEPPRELWERLRAEGPVKGAGGREVARWVLVEAWTMSEAQPLYSGPGRQNGVVKWQERPGIATRLASLPALPPTVVGADARVVDPREVARWVLLGAWAFRAGQPQTGFRDPWGGLSGSAKGTGQGSDGITRAGLATRLASLPALPPTVVGADAREVDPPPRLDGVYVYIDPPYVNTTPYGADLSRAEVVAMARRWHEAGAVVAISEQVPVLGWADDLWPVDITETRKGQKRTFSKQRNEWLTLNRKPVQAPAEQLCLAWAGA
jgi:hypothetical protein